MDMYARVLAEAAGRGERVAPWVRFFIQCGSQDVSATARNALSRRLPAGRATFLEPSCEPASMPVRESRDALKK